MFHNLTPFKKKKEKTRNTTPEPFLRHKFSITIIINNPYYLISYFHIRRDKSPYLATQTSKNLFWCCQGRKGVGGVDAKSVADRYSVTGTRVQWPGARAFDPPPPLYCKGRPPQLFEIGGGRGWFGDRVMKKSWRFSASVCLRSQKLRKRETDVLEEGNVYIMTAFMALILVKGDFLLYFRKICVFCISLKDLYVKSHNYTSEIIKNCLEIQSWCLKHTNKHTGNIHI